MFHLHSCAFCEHDECEHNVHEQVRHRSATVCESADVLHGASVLRCLCCGGRGHLSQGRALMAPYLPRDGASGSPYSEGGALYALGLIHANHGQDIRGFLLESLRGTQNEVRRLLCWHFVPCRSISTGIFAHAAGHA